MIGKIKGTLAEIYEETGLIETASGVYYSVVLPPSVLGEAIVVGLPIELYTYLHVREDELSLFGFDTKERQKVFYQLMSVDGVGAKMAFKIIYASTVSDLMSAVYSQNIEYFQNVKGVGKKIAQRIIVDFSSKLKADVDLQQLQAEGYDRDAVDALVSLGFRRQDAKNALAGVDKALTTEEKIRAGLKIMSKKN